MPDTAAHPDYDPAAGRIPDKARVFGMSVFLAALGMLFIAAIGLYIVVRLQVLNADAEPNPPLGAITLPPLLWISTLIMLGSAVALQYAVGSIAKGNRSLFRSTLATTAALGLIFLGVQIPALYQLVERHGGLVDQDIQLYAIMALLVIIHAAHVIGGIIPLLLITRNALRGKYTAERHQPVRLMAMYWHFIDVVWIVMFLVWVVIG